MVLFFLIIWFNAAYCWIFAKEETECKLHDIACFGDKLYSLYEEEIKPIEQATLFHQFVLPPLSRSHFLNTKSIITVLGQYSSGKTTFTNFLLGDEYKGQFTSLSASTSEFTFIGDINDASTKQTCDPQHGSCKNTLNTAPDHSDGKYFVMNSKTPFNVYQYFEGTEVIKSVRAAFVDSAFLNDAYIIDTPGILTNSKDSCNYLQFYNTIYFQSDLVIFIFDPYKASDLESAKMIFSLLQNSANKIRFVINKADSLTYRSLLDVYGAIQYNLGTFGIFESLEINRFYFTSLWNHSCISNDESLCQIVNKDKNELLKELDGLKNTKLKIQSKIQSLNERIQMVKKNAILVENYVNRNCDCGFYRGCKCSDDDDSQSCYLQYISRYLKALEFRNEHTKIRNFNYLHETYTQRLDKAGKDLNSIAEKLEK